MNRTSALGRWAKVKDMVCSSVEWLESKGKVKPLMRESYHRLPNMVVDSNLHLITFTLELIREVKCMELACFLIFARTHSIMANSRLARKMVVVAF